MLVFSVVDRSTIELVFGKEVLVILLVCGTGACAAVAVGQKWGLDHKVEVIQEGGVLDIIADKIEVN